MLDLDKMSAPTSLTMSAKDQAANGGQFMSSAEFVAKQKTIKDFELIETKFNQLAKKILDELKQAQYSREFFQAIDDIIKEPLRTTIKIARSSPEQKRQQQQLAHKQATYNHLTHQKQLNHNSVGSGSNTTTKHHQTIQQQARGNQQQQQPRSLPVEMVPSQTVAQSSVPQKHRSAIPTSSIQNGFANSCSPRKSFSGEGQIQRQQQQPQHKQQQQQLYPISRSATVGSAFERRQSFRKSPTGPSSIEEEFQNNLYRRQKNYSTSSVLTNNFSRSIDDYNNENDDNEENDLEDDDDDDDEDDDLDEDIEFSPIESPQKQQHQQLMKQHLQQQQQQQQRFNQRFNPITKSKTLSDTTNISETSRQTKLQHQQQGNHRQQLAAQQHVQNQKHRFSPGQPTSSSLSCSYQTSEAEPKSTMSLNSRDIGSLYKPHMNYSTSMLGNHRLSDDDEIIIIPTQSPSLISTSPDNNEANGDDPTERFSISRTKSFWEKLSKGNHSKRSSKTGSPNDNPSTSIQATTTITNIGGKHSATDGLHNKHLHGKGKVLGLKLNGHSHTLDCMDSTGGSNSNYSCSSSSGDENGVSQSSHQNPTISKLQEMSRQNRFRQTR